MPKIGKAARGKHRWIGLEFSSKFSNYEVLRDELKNKLSYSKLKIYDFVVDGDRRTCIIKVDLEDYIVVRSKLGTPGDILSVTSSGKIKLVRNRLDELFQR